MKKIILIIIPVFFLTVSGYPQSGWQAISSGVTVNLYGLYFLNINTGYACGAGGTILKTTNAGLNWNPLNSSVSYQLSDICFTDNANGYCAGSSGILKTTNSGIIWLSVFNMQMNKICRAGNVIFAGGQSGIYKSTDSGQTWINVLSSSSGTINAIFFNNSNTGYGMGNDGLQRKTTNGGLNWLSGAYWGPGTYNFGECHFFNSDTGFAAYSYNSGYPNYNTGYGIFKATYWSTGGSSWILVYSSSNKGIGGLTFTGRDTGYAVGGGWTGSQYESIILKTINGGNNWTPQSFVINQVLQDVYFVDSKYGYAVGRTGTILKTETGGVAGIRNISGIIPEKFSLSQNYPNPFNPVTRIRFSVPSLSFRHDLSRNPVILKVYDIAGREVQTLVNERLNPGTYEVSFDGSTLNSGVYFYQLIINNEQLATKRMILMK